MRLDIWGGSRSSNPGKSHKPCEVHLPCDSLAVSTVPLCQSRADSAPPWAPSDTKATNGAPCNVRDTQMEASPSSRLEPLTLAAFPSPHGAPEIGSVPILLFEARDPVGKPKGHRAPLVRETSPTRTIEKQTLMGLGHGPSANCRISPEAVCMQAL